MHDAQQQINTFFRNYHHLDHIVTNHFIAYRLRCC